MSGLKLYISLFKGKDTENYYVSVHKNTEDGPLIMFIEVGPDRDDAVYIMDQICEILKKYHGQISHYFDKYRN